MKLDGSRVATALAQRRLVQIAVVLLATSPAVSFGQECNPPQGRPDSGTMKATVLVRTSALLVQSGDELFGLYRPGRQRRDAFVGFREGDLVEVTYSGLLECRYESSAEVVKIIKKGTSPRSAVSPTGVRTMTAVLTWKEEIRNDRLRGDNRQISVDADRAKYGNCAWSFGVSFDNPVFPKLKPGDLLRITYLAGGMFGAGHLCHGTAWRLAVLRSVKRNR